MEQSGGSFRWHTIPNLLTKMRSMTTDGVRVSGISTTGFTCHVEKGHGGGNDTWTVQWIATDAGDP